MLNCASLRVVFAFLISDGIPVPIRAYPVLLQLGAAFVTQRLGLIFGPPGTGTSKLELVTKVEINQPRN